MLPIGGARAPGGLGGSALGGSALGGSALGGASYAWCGDVYIREALLYHLTRADAKHNFSPYFYAVRHHTGTEPLD